MNTGTVALCTIAVLTAAVVGPAAAQLDRIPPEVPLQGENGLYVAERDDTVRVHWITQYPEAGLLEVWVSDSLVQSAMTDSGRAHSTAITNRAAAELLLRYGGKRHTTDRHNTVLSLEPRPKRAESVVKRADSIYVLGDVHGQFESLVTLLENAKVIDGDHRWTGGKAHVVFLGDLFDRGNDVVRTLWFIYRLEREARKQGGAIHVVLGNHEIMTFLYDHRYVAPKEELVALFHGTRYGTMFNVEESVLGRWLASKPGILKIEDIVFAHGGVTPTYAHFDVEEYNDSLYRYLYDPMFLDLLSEDPAVVARYDSLQFLQRLAFFFYDGTPFWYRGYVQGQQSDTMDMAKSETVVMQAREHDTLRLQLDYVLDRYDARLHVVAHTPVESVAPRFGGKLVAVDLLKPATEMLLLVRDRKKRRRYRIDSDGNVTELKAERIS